MEPAPVPLSPSRVSDFKSCPQLFKFRAVDRLPEPVEPSALRGRVVHAVLERLHGLPAPERTLLRARVLLLEVWADSQAEEALATLMLTREEAEIWRAEAEDLLANYFRIEEPALIEPHELEWSVQHESERTVLRGIIDRVDRLPDGGWSLTDYKTGASPSEGYAFGSFFALRFYALVCWRAFGKLPKELRLIYLRAPEVITLVPTPQLLDGLERQLDALARAIGRAHMTGDWRPRPSSLCSRCPHRPICPAWQTEPLHGAARGESANRRSSLGRGPQEALFTASGQ